MQLQPLGLGSRQWRDFFSSTTGWHTVSLAPSRSRRAFDPVAKPTGPTVVHLAPGEYTGPLHIASPHPVLLRPSQLGEAAKVVIRCPEPDRTSRRVKYVGGSGDSAGSASEELPLEPALILSNGAQVFVEGLHFHGRVEVLDGASVEFLDCTMRLAPHVASAAAQIAGASNSVNTSSQQQHTPAPPATTGKGGHAIYRTAAAASGTAGGGSGASAVLMSKSQRNALNGGGGGSGDLVVGAGALRATDMLARELSAVSVLAANMWASNCVIDVLAPNGVGLLASSFVDPAAAATGDFEAEDDYRAQQQNKINAGKAAHSGGNINIAACVLRRATYGFVFYGDSGFAPRVENNKISGCSAAGLVCSGASRGSLRGNHIGHCDRFGVVLEGRCAPWLHMNIVEENGLCGVAVRDCATPTLVRNTVLANGTLQLYCADVASVRAQNSHFSGESVNGAAPSAAGLSSFAARAILEAPRGDVYAVCATDNANLLLDNCVIECADSCVIAATGATVKCSNCTLQPEAADRKAASDAVAEHEASIRGGDDADGAAAAAGAASGQNNDGNDNDGDDSATPQKTQQSSKAAASNQSYPAHRAFVKSDFATLTTDGSVVAGAKKIEVRALEDFPDVDAVITELPKYLFASAHQLLMQNGGNSGGEDGGEYVSPRRGPAAAAAAAAPSQPRRNSPPPQGVTGLRTDAAIRMSLSFTPRRPLSATSGGGGASSARRQSSRAIGGGPLLSSSSSAAAAAAAGGSFYGVSPAAAGDNAGGSGTAGRRHYSRPSTAGGAAGGSTASAQRLNRFDPPVEKTDWHELKDKKQIYALKVEVSRLRKQLYSNNNNNNNASATTANSPRSASATTTTAAATNQQQQHRIIGGGDMEEGSTHNLGYHTWNNSKMHDFYHGKATLAEVRCERRPIPGTDVSLGERLHDRWLRHKLDEHAHAAEEEQARAQEQRSHALSREQQAELGKRLHDECMEKFRKDRARILREENERNRIHAPFLEKNATRRSKQDAAAAGGALSAADGSGDNEAKNSANEEEELRCQRISDRLKEQAEARARMRDRLEVKYLLKPMEDAHSKEKKLSRKQIEAYCASLHKSHRDEALAAKAYDTVNLEFAQKAKARDDALRAELLGKPSTSPKRSREQIAAYSESLYKGHSDAVAFERAKSMLDS